MRRLLRKIAIAEYDGLGDISTLANPDIVEKIIDGHKAMQNQTKLLQTKVKKEQV